MDKNDIEAYHKNILREEIDKLVNQWKEQEDKYNQKLNQDWQKSDFKGFPKDYHTDKDRMIQRGKERNDISHLKKIIPNGIEFIRLGETNQICHAYTISNIQELSDLLEGDKALEQGKELLSTLKNKGLLKESVSGKIVLYFSDHGFMHSGIIKKTNFVESKWGVGNMYRHGLEEVPLRYGVPQRFKLHGTKKEFQEFSKKFKSK